MNMPNSGITLFGLPETTGLGEVLEKRERHKYDKLQINPEQHGKHLNVSVKGLLNLRHRSQI
jgi:hypothetical protein